MSGDVGKITRVRGMNYQGLDISGANGIPVPGKTTLAGQERSSGVARASDIGNAYAEGRGFCQQRPDARGCELKPEEFRILVDLYQKRVGQAASNYGDALGELRVDTLLKNEPDPVPLLRIFIDVMSTMALGGIGSALAMLRSNPAAAAHGLGLGVRDFEVSAGGDLAGGGAVDPHTFGNFMDSSQDAISWIVKAAVDQGKSALKAPPPSGEKGQTLSYIETLQNASAIAWERQREDPPGYATHADLIVLFHTFSAANGFTTPIIKRALTDKLERYLASSTARIGRNKATTQRDFDVQGNTVRDTKVAWVPDGNGTPTLHYMKRDAPNDQGRNADDHTLELIRPIDSEFVVGKPVEPEFIEVALSRHKDIWGTDPEVRGTAPNFNQHDPRTWVPKAHP